MLDDTVLSHQASITLGAEALQQLAAEFTDKNAHFEAAKAKVALASFHGSDKTAITSLFREALALLQQSKPLTTHEQHQLVSRLTFRA